MDKNLSQDVERNRDNDWCAENSKRHDEDNREGKHDDYGDKKNYSKSQYQQPNHECDEYP